MTTAIRNVKVLDFLAFQSSHPLICARDLELPEEQPVFPILRGTSVSESGEFSGYVHIVNTPKDLDFEWQADTIAVISDDMEQFFEDNPKTLDDLFADVRTVLAEFGESISQFATFATQHNAIAVIGIADATSVLENGMHIRVEAVENQGDVFFID